MISWWNISDLCGFPLLVRIEIFMAYRHFCAAISLWVREEIFGKTFEKNVSKLFLLL